MANNLPKHPSREQAAADYAADLWNKRKKTLINVPQEVHDNAFKACVRTATEHWGENRFDDGRGLKFYRTVYRLLSKRSNDKQARLRESTYLPPSPTAVVKEVTASVSKVSQPKTGQQVIPAVLSQVRKSKVEKPQKRYREAINKPDMVQEFLSLFPEVPRLHWDF